MSFQSELGAIRWKVHFMSSPQVVFDALTSDEGRAKFWAESAPEIDGKIIFHILNYKPYESKILEKVSPSLFRLEYFGTEVAFSLEAGDKGGTDLRLHAIGVDEPYRMEMVAGWVSVLMSMKAAVDHQVDLRNHDSNLAWDQGYLDN